MKICILLRRQRSAHHQADGELVSSVLTKICIPSRRCRVEVDGRGLDEDLHASTERHLVDVGEFVLDQDMGVRMPT